jgi:ABC-type polysaccharide/polyol phosphate export permease
VSPELGAVLAYPYALLLVAALGSRYTQLLLGVALLYIIFGVEYREMPAQNLLFPVAFFMCSAPGFQLTIRP